MIKLTFCLHRLPGLSREAFQRHWREVHAPLVAQRAALLGIRRYVQNHSLDHPIYARMAAGRGAPEPFDGVAELWLDLPQPGAPIDPAAQLANRELLDDERRFIDLSRSPLFVTQPIEIVALDEARP